MAEPQAPRRRAPAARMVLIAGLALVVVVILIATRRPAVETTGTPVASGGAGERGPAANGPRPGETVGNAPADHVSNSPAAPPAPAPNPNELPPEHPEVVEAPEGTQVTLQWLGDSCFYLHSPGGAAAVADPFDPKSTGLEAPETGAHVVTLSSNDPQHDNAGAVHAFQGEQKQVVRGREARVKDLRILPVETGPGRFAYVYETAGMRIAHLGDLERPLTADQVKRLGAVDILLVPAGGRGVTPKQAVEIAKQVAPKIVVPMAYSTSGMEGPDARLRPVEDFIAASPFAVTNKDMDTMLIGKSQLPASTEIYTLRFRP